MGTNREFRVYFYEFNEDTIWNKKETCKKKRKVGDILEGNLFIGWVTQIEKSTSDYMFFQPAKEKFTTIEVVVEITKKINETTFFVKNCIVEREILIKTEMDTNYDVGDRLHLFGSLQIELLEYVEMLELLENKII